MTITLRETIESLRDGIVADIDKGYVPGPEFLARLRKHLDEAIDRDTLEHIDRCTLNDWCRGPLEHDGECTGFENAEMLFDFFSQNGLVKVEIVKALNQPARCTVRHNDVLLFDGEEDSVLMTVKPEAATPRQPVTDETSSR